MREIERIIETGEIERTDNQEEDDVEEIVLAPHMLECTVAHVLDQDGVCGKERRDEMITALWAGALSRFFRLAFENLFINTTKDMILQMLY